MRRYLLQGITSKCAFLVLTNSVGRNFARPDWLPELLPSTKCEKIHSTNPESLSIKTLTKLLQSDVLYYKGYLFIIIHLFSKY